MARVSRKNQSEVKITYKVGVYLRISVEDERKKENNSLQNQENLVCDYLKHKSEFEIFKIYSDVNQTGTNFNRPYFKEMMQDVKNKEINCIIVKDLSRFGRNYIEVGKYLEYLFPFLNVRFISINDNYDSFSPSSESFVIPVKNLLNEMYVRDISKKICVQKEIKRKKGDFCGSIPPYGYIRDGNGLKVDEEVAPVVKYIFEQFLDGVGANSIALKLNDKKQLPPSRYRYEKGIVSSEKYKTATYWHKSAVKRILTNEVYTGNIVSGRNIRSKMSKNTDIVITENSHKPLVSIKDFEAVRELISQKTVEKSQDTEIFENILKGMVYCKDCGSKMYRYKRKRADNTIDYRFLCSSYENLDRNSCTRKYFSQDRVIKALNSVLTKQIELFENSIKDTKHDNTKQLKLDKILKFESALYDDYSCEIISRDEYLKRKKELKKQALSISREIARDKKIEQQKEIHSKLLNLELNRDILEKLIEKIEINKYDEVEITFNYKNEFENM